MEIIIGLVLVAGLAFYLLRKNKALEAADTEAPYKVETPTPDWELPKVDEPATKPQEAVVEAAKPAEEAKPKATKAKAPKAAPKAAKPKAPAMKVVKGDGSKKAPAKTSKPKKSGK